jgi:CxxC-x17-CxxC domain-containing protein
MSGQNDISFFAKTNFRNQDRIFGIKEDDRRRHMYVIGKSGMGKTNLLENLAIQDIKHGKGIAFVDPHGDSAEKLIKAIPANRINDVIYFNPADQEFPIAFNVMEKVGAEYRHLIASGLIGVFKKLWADSWGPRLEYILRNAILALLEYPGSTLLGVTRILVDKDYREKVVAKITDPVVRSFWVDEFTKWNDRVLQEVISPIQNKVGAFLTTSLIRNIIGQTTSSFDIRDVMDNQKILILNLSKGRVGEDASALLGAMMITKIQLAAMERVDILEEDRKDFYLYVDEFQNFATESFANILSEARKYRLDLILANQYIEQIDEKVASAIFGNAGTLISFRVGATDAEYLEKEFTPVFLAPDIVNLPKFNVYLKLMIDGIAGDAFSATTLPPISLDETVGNAEKVIANSRERYSTSKKDVEDKIRRWSGMITEEERAELLKKKESLSPLKPSVSAPAIPGQTSAIGAHAPARLKPAAPPERKAVLPIMERKMTMTRESVSLVKETVSTTAPTSAATAPSAEDTVEAKPAVSAEEGTSLPAGLREEDVVVKLPTEADTSEERITYPAICDACETEIRVPFEPDGKRPTFCKECFKAHQRTVAQTKGASERDEQQRGREAIHEEWQGGAPARKPYEKPKRTIESKIYVPSDHPMSLSQVSLVAPKKFKSLRDRPNPNLDAVRDILKSRQREG